jgi:hypothetical protein
MEQREHDGLSTSDLADQQPRPAAETPAPGPADMPEPQVSDATPSGGGEPPAGLIESARLGEFRGRWSDVQAGFVDDPRRTVEEADHLVAELFQVLAQTFAEGRSRLEDQWSRGELGTEDLRQLVHRYRALFDTLLRS